jgi:hypothetical protein
LGRAGVLPQRFHLELVVDATADAEEKKDQTVITQPASAEGKAEAPK